MSETTDLADRRKPGTCGFTLVEVLVILAILSLMAGVVFPAVEKALRRETFAESVRRVEFGLHAARAMAINDDAPVRFAIAADRHGFTYAGHGDRLPDTILITSRNQGVAFFPDGSAIGSDIAITDGGLTERLVVQSALGSIERAK